MESLLPEIRPEELNKLLILLGELGEETGLTKGTLVSAMRSTTYGAQVGSAQSTLDLANILGFIQIAPRDVIRLTNEGSRLISLNPDRTYELAPAQARFLTSRCMAIPPLNQVFRTLLGRFARDTKRATFSLRLPAPMSSVERSLFVFLTRLGFIAIRGVDAEVAITYRDQASVLRNSRAISQEELELMLALRRQQGDAAERWVVCAEKERLRNNGSHAEADAVDRVSVTDVSAGYDLASFNGDSPTLRHDRFIEVKSTTGDRAMFIWTINEYEKASELRESYWIYLLLRFNAETGEHVGFLRIQDPVSKCLPGGDLLLDTQAFQVTIPVPLKFIA